MVADRQTTPVEEKQKLYLNLLQKRIPLTQSAVEEKQKLYLNYKIICIKYSLTVLKRNKSCI